MENKILLDKDTEIINEYEEKILILFNKEDINKTYNLKKGSKLTIYQYIVDSSSNLVINLDGIDSSIEYHYSTINYKDNYLNIKVNHNNCNTTSNIFCHGLNVYDKKLDFHVEGIVPKESDNCICNQENQIINMENGNSTILPILLIDNYNVDSSHSAYIGKFKDKILFYLMSRGISKKISYELLMKSFLMNSLLEETKESNLFIEEIKKI